MFSKSLKPQTRLDVTTIYEIDDLIFDSDHYPEPIETYGEDFPIREYSGLQISPTYADGVARHCDYGIASTPDLAAELEKVVRTGVVAVHRNAISSVHEDAIRSITPRADTSKVRIFYGSGTKAHKEFFRSTFLSAMESVLSKRENVELHVYGYINSTQLKEAFPGRVIEREPEWKVSKYWQALSQADINVAVLKKSLLTDCKSEIKWLEAAMLGVPSVVSGTSTMMGTIKEGETGVFANDRAEWEEALLMLVDDVSLRRRMGNLARTDVLKRYSLDSGAQSIQSALDSFERHAADEATS